MIMSQANFYGLLGVVSVLLSGGGCASTQPGKAATLALKFVPQDVAVYRVVTESTRGVEFRGEMPDKSTFQGGHNRSRAEIVFSQEHQSYDPNGNLVARITIKELKYSSTVKDKPVMDFDSSMAEAKKHPLVNLIGQAYTIKIAPTGEVTDVVDVNEAKAAVKGGTVVNKVLSDLLSDEAIKVRHSVPAMPGAEANPIQVGSSWSRIKSFSFGLMGSKSYEKVYTLKRIEQADGRRVAVAEMKAIPSSARAEELQQEQPTGDFARMFDNSETYTGHLELDLDRGKVLAYSEELRSEWVAVDPSVRQEENKEPAALKMTSSRVYRLECLD